LWRRDSFLTIGTIISCALFAGETSLNTEECNFLDDEVNLDVTVGTKLYSDACCNCGGGQHVV